MPRPLTILFNPRAGGARGPTPAGLAHALKAHRLDFEIVQPTSAAELAERAREAAIAGSTVVVAGGDGTIHAAANGVLGAGVPDAELGVIPLGSGNDFAHSLGRVGQDLEAAVNALATPLIQPIDVGRVNGSEYFVNGLGVGFDAEVVRRRGGRRVGPLGYLPTVARTILSYAPRNYRVLWKDEEFLQRGLMVAVMNGSSEGGGFCLAPKAQLYDGVLDICWIDPINLWQFVRYVLAVKRGTHVSLPMVKMWRSREICLESDESLSYHVDGEYRELQKGTPLEIEVVEKRLRLIT